MPPRGPGPPRLWMDGYEADIGTRVGEGPAARSTFAGFGDLSLVLRVPRQ